MTLNQILNEVNVEFGNGQTLAVTDSLKSNKTIDKTGDKDELQLKTADIKTMNNDTKQAVSNIVTYLKKKNLFDKVATKQNFATTDVVMQADGSCTINFDDGGSFKIPKEVLAAQIQPQQKPSFLANLKQAFSASVETEDEEVSESYFPY